MKREAEHFKESVKQQKRKKRKRETAENEGTTAEEAAVTPAKKPFLFRQEEGVRRQVRARLSLFLDISLQDCRAGASR